MLDSRASFKDLLSNIDTLVDRAGTSAAAAKIAAAKTAASQSEAIDSAVADVTAQAKHAANSLRSAVAERQQKRAEKVAIARHILRTATRLAG